MTDTLKASPQNEIMSKLSQMLKSGKESLNQYEVKDWVPLLGGTGVGEMLMGNAPELVEDISYKGLKGIITGGNVATGGVGTLGLDKRTLDAAMLAADVVGLGQGFKSIVQAGVRKVGEEIGKTTSTSRREFAKKAGAVGAGALIAPKLMEITRPAVKEGIEQGVKRVADNATIPTSTKHKFNTLAEYNDWLDEKVVLTEGKLSKQEMAQFDEDIYVGVKRLKEKQLAGEKLTEKEAGYLNEMSSVLDEFSPQAKAEMRAFKRNHDSFSSLNHYIEYDRIPFDNPDLIMSNQPNKFFKEDILDPNTGEVLVEGGLGGLTARQLISRGTETAKEVFDPEKLSRRLKEPGEEGGMHVSVSTNTSELMTYNYETGERGTHITMKSKVDSPYWVEDTKGTWHPDQMIQQISKANMNPNGTRKLDDKAIKKLNEIYRKYQEETNGDWRTVPVKKIKEIWNTRNKEIQKVLRDNGYDHISYINKKEGQEGLESAIIFDREDVEFLKAD